MNYTKEDLMRNHIIVFCKTETEYNHMCAIVGFKVANGYYGPYCYSPSRNTFCDDSSEINFGEYWDIPNVQIVRIPMASTRTISAQDAKRIIDIACAAWKVRLAEIWGKNITLGYKIDIPEDFYKQMRGACTITQSQLFDEIFKDDFKPGDWVVTTKEEIGAYKPQVGEVFQIDLVGSDHVRFDKYNPVSKSRIRKATEEEIRIAQLPKDGEPCWVRDYKESEWKLRYANGKGQFYIDLKKSGTALIWKYWMKFDPNNLPVNG